MIIIKYLLLCTRWTQVVTLMTQPIAGISGFQVPGELQSCFYLTITERDLPYGTYIQKVL